MSNHRSVHALELGGTLFIPASHKNLGAVLSGEKYPELRSVVIDFEDGLAGSDRLKAIEKLEKALSTLQANRLLRFIRPKDPEMLQSLLRKEHIDRLDGFVLPKFGLENAHQYLSSIQNSKLKIQNFMFMPSIEGEELFDTNKLRQLRNILLPYRENIICIRFGAQDMLRQLGLKQTGSIYDMLAPAQVVGNLIAAFKPHGFEISAPVYPDFSESEGFHKEVQRELENGLISKTIIHPNQIAPMNRLYNVTKAELEASKKLLALSDGVINLGGEMGEFKTQSPWAEQIVKRAELFDVV